MVKRKIRKFIPKIIIKIYHFLWAFLAAIATGFPGKDIKVIGVTGTNGKSTTVKLIAEILKTSGRSVAVISSIGFEVAGEERKNLMKMTMPGRGFIHKFLRESIEKGCDVAVLEVTSEGIEQFRHKFLNVDIAVITNLAPEHIESHGGFENYKNAKGKLFEEVDDVHVLNFDDRYVDFFNSFKANKKYGYGLEGKGDFNKLLKPTSFDVSSDKITFKLNGDNFELRMPGKFNIYNSLAALAVSLEMDIETEEIKKAFSKIKGIPGRMEKVIDDDFTVFVDYAFTPNALEQVYSSIKDKMNPEKMIVVLGACGGGRDKWKRPVLGEIADRFADEIIITNEDPYDEDPEEIIEQVAEGANGRARKIIDRREAINKAINLANKGDVVVITGKGSESWIQIKNGKKVPWDDREVVREEYNKQKNEA